ncbi:MAG: hypothetical protein M3Q29_15560 [Chloroflexota bacterium]|nr:hypothetical protein [Chloroflexota bacterium]
MKAYRAQLAALRNDFKSWLRANAPKATVTGEFDLALNVVTVKLNGTSLTTLRSSTLVQRAEYEGSTTPRPTRTPTSRLLTLSRRGALAVASLRRARA